MINGKLTFIDLFAGIGGFRYGISRAMRQRVPAKDAEKEIM